MPAVKSQKQTKAKQVNRKPEPKSARTKAQNGTVFVCDIKPNAKEVYVVGEFNDWDPRSDKLVKKKGMFTKMMQLDPGEYQYKFFIDGEWHCDPSAKTQVPNEFGTFNSVVHVDEISGE